MGLCHKKPTDQNDFYTERKEKKQAFQRCLWKRIRFMFRRDMVFWILHILRPLSKNRHGNFAVSSFVGFSIEENIHESESTRTLIAKASKLNMYIHNIHLHNFSIKLISPVIAVARLQNTRPQIKMANLKRCYRGAAVVYLKHCFRGAAAVVFSRCTRSPVIVNPGHKIAILKHCYRSTAVVL